MLQTALNWPKADPRELIDYAIDWTAWLALNEAIITSSWVVPIPIVGTFTSINGAKTIIWLTGGLEGQVYNIVNTITTNQGRIGVRTVQLPVGAH